MMMMIKIGHYHTDEVFSCMVAETNFLLIYILCSIQKSEIGLCILQEKFCF